MEPEQRKHLSPWISWGIIFLAVIIIAALLGYYYWQTNRETTKTPVATTTSTNTTASSITTTTTSSSISDSTIADWQKYTSPSFGYSIEFPKTWSWNGTDTKIVTFDSPANAKLISETRPNTESPPHEITIYYYPTIAGAESNDNSSTLDELMKNSTLSNIGDTLLGGSSAKEAIQSEMFDKYTVFAVKNNHLYKIAFSATDKSKLSATDSQILTTFKFTQ